MERAWGASHSELQNARITDGLVNEFIEHRKRFDISKFSSLLSKQDIRLVCFFDDDFPELLSHIFDPPAVLFVRGFLNPSMPTVSRAQQHPTISYCVPPMTIHKINRVQVA